MLRPTLSALAVVSFFSLPLLGQDFAKPTAKTDAAFYGGAAWRAFLADSPGEWSLDWCAATGTPRAIWGAGITLIGWRENSIEEARRHAHKLLADRAELLGLGTSEFREGIGARMGRVWSFTFDQFFRGLPVIRGRADVRLHMTGRVSMFGSTAWQVPDEFSVTPALDEVTATALAWQSLGEPPTGTAQPTPITPPRLVIWGDINANQVQKPVLAWEVAISNVDGNGLGKIGRCYVDARTGIVLSFTNDKHECGSGCTDAMHGAIAKSPTAKADAAAPISTTVTVQAWTRTGIDGFSALVNVPLPGLVLDVPGIGNVTTDNNGQFVIDIAVPVNITVGGLDGRHHGPIAGIEAPSGVFVVNPGVAMTIQLLTAAATLNAAAHTSMSYWCEQSNELARTIFGNVPQLADLDRMVPTVNIPIASSNDYCKAYYSRNSINFFQAGGPCTNLASATIIAHEWCHGLDDRYGGVGNDLYDGLGEGWADLFSLYLVDSPLHGLGSQVAGVAARDGNNTVQYPCAAAACASRHFAGQSWMGFGWKLRDRLATTLPLGRSQAIAVTNDIVLGSIVANAMRQNFAVTEVFLADDDDGNLNNGTPHSAELIWACQQHSLPFPNMPGHANEECSGALPLVLGQNGPFSNHNSSTSLPGWSCPATGNDVWFRCDVLNAGTLTISTCGLANFDTAIQIFFGACGAGNSTCVDNSCGLQETAVVPVVAGSYYVRVGGHNGATGTFSLTVSGPLAVASVPYGAACGLASKSFYELFRNENFDLEHSTMRLVPTNGYYVAQQGGAFVAPPVGAATLALTDESFAMVNLASPFPFLGGSTTSLEVCSNGMVSVAPGNSTWPLFAQGFSMAQPRWESWHDYNPTLPGSGQVKFHEAGTVSYVTWDGVLTQSNYVLGADTFQFQFDRSTGAVTYAWQAMDSADNRYNDSLYSVGYSAAGLSVDPGWMNISAEVPATFRTSADNAQPLALASTLPRIGTTLTFTTSNFPASSGFGVQILGVQRFTPGVDLTFLGMPGCLLHTSLDMVNVLFPASQVGTYSIPVPNDPGMQGGLIRAQSAAWVDGVNAAGLITSNGLELGVGI